MAAAASGCLLRPPRLPLRRDVSLGDVQPGPGTVAVPEDLAAGLLGGPHPAMLEAH